jgi:alanine racemase
MTDTTLTTEPPAVKAGLAGAVLTIDLDAIGANWRALAKRSAPAEAAAVVKADAYGLGMATVAPALWRAGARSFFVAHVGEAIALRGLLDPSARIGVLNGLMPGSEPAMREHGLLPVLNDLGQIDRWAAEGRAAGQPLHAYIHIDTGMSRLGLPPGEVDTLAAEPERLDGIAIAAWMTHLACADEIGHPMLDIQRVSFVNALNRLPDAPASIANSSGIFRDRALHMDLVRPGCALYGVNPTAEAPHPLNHPVRLDARILQVRPLVPGQPVGYGSSWRAGQPGRLATLPVGYADGYLRTASNAGRVFIDGIACPVVGKVSMDLLTVDVSAVPEGRAVPDAMVEVLGPHRGVDELAHNAGTIGYEVLTSLGDRYARRYTGDGTGQPGADSTLLGA